MIHLFALFRFYGFIVLGPWGVVILYVFMLASLCLCGFVAIGDVSSHRCSYVLLFIMFVVD